MTSDNKKGLFLELSRDAEKTIAAFRGLPFLFGDQQNRREKTISELLPSLIREFSIDGTTTEQTIMENWEKIVGSTYSPFSFLMKLEKEKHAIFGVTHAIARQELNMQKRRILREIQKLPGCQGIAFLSFRAG